MDVINKKNYKVYHLIYDKSKSTQSNLFAILPNEFVPKSLPQRSTQNIPTDSMAMLSFIQERCIAYYRTVWDFDVNESYGMFVSVNPLFRGMGLSSYLYILNAHKAEKRGLKKHLADFSATSGLGPRESKKVFNKLYGKLGMTLVEPGMPEMTGYTSRISGNTPIRMLCRNYVVRFPEIYSQRSQWCSKSRKLSTSIVRKSKSRTRSRSKSRSRSRKWSAS